MATVQGIYVALFGRPADPEGLSYWTAETADDADLTCFTSQLMAQPEGVDRYGALSNSEVVTLIYQTLFGRDPEPAGLAWYVNQLESGLLTHESIAINILDGALGADLTVVNNKIAAAEIFTLHLDQESEIDAYVGPDAAQAGREYIASIYADCDLPTPQDFPSDGLTGLPPPLYWE